jgi:sulfate permease, SulP family
METYGASAGGNFEAAHGFLVLVSILAGLVLMALGLAGMGKFGKLVPNSIVVGFTVGIAVVIAMSNLGEILGLKVALQGSLLNKLGVLAQNVGEVNPSAALVALVTFGITIALLRISIFFPAPLLALGAGTLLARTLLAGQGITSIGDRFGKIPTNFFVFTGPALPANTLGVWLDVLYYVLAIVFVSGVESLLCSSMADRLANNKGTPFNPDKEFWGQGLVQIITPLVNGFPCTGALARTATSIKAGALSPLAGYFKGILKLSMAYFIASALENVPMACIGGILLWVAKNMVKPAEIREIQREGRFETGMMIYTAVAVPATDFLTGVLSALVLYFVARRLFPQATRRHDLVENTAIATTSASNTENTI